MTAITMRAFMTAMVTGELVINTKNEKDEVIQITKSIFNEDGTLIPEIAEYANEQIVKIDKRNETRSKKGASKKTPKQIENDTLRETILSMMEVGVTYTSRDIIDFEIEGVASSQKVTALMKGLVAEGKVIANQVKTEGSKGKVKGYALVKKTNGESEIETEVESEEEVEVEVEETSEDNE